MASKRLCLRFTPSTTFPIPAPNTFASSHAPCTPSIASQCDFSTSAHLAKRPDRFRGVSPLRKTGPAQRLSVHKHPLPKPTQAKRRRQPKTAEDHGLWAFFKEDKTCLMTPSELAAHGRAWTFQELRRKSWEDLHSLWWVCMKQSNMVNTSENERQRLRAGFGAREAQTRLEEIKITQKRILAVLTQRWYQWEDAYALAKEDPSVKMSSTTAEYDAHLEESKGAESVQNSATGTQAPVRPFLTPQFSASQPNEQQKQ